MGVDQYSWPQMSMANFSYEVGHIIFLVVFPNGNPMFIGPLDHPPHRTRHFCPAMAKTFWISWEDGMVPEIG